MIEGQFPPIHPLLRLYAPMRLLQIRNCFAIYLVTNSDGPSPKRSSPSGSRALKVELEPRPSPGSSNKFEPESWRASTFYFIKTQIFWALLKTLSPSLGWAWALLKISSPSPKKWTGPGWAQAKPGLGPITSNKILHVRCLVLPHFLDLLWFSVCSCSDHLYFLRTHNPSWKKVTF